MELDRWLDRIPGITIRKFVAHHLAYGQVDIRKLDKFISANAFPLKRFIGTMVKSFGAKAYYGSLFLLSFLEYCENAGNYDGKWLDITLAFISEDFCTEEAIKLLKDHDLYLDRPIKMVADHCPEMIFYFNTFLNGNGRDFKIGFFSVLELIRITLENDTNGNCKAVKH